METELAPALALMVQRLLQLLRRDALLFEKQFAYLEGHFAITRPMGAHIPGRIRQPRVVRS